MKDKLEFVSSIITNEKGNVLLLKRKDTLSLDPGKYDLCSGHMKEGEVPMQSMLRELEEELGITLEDIKNIGKIADIRTPHTKFINTICHIYHVEIDLSIEEINKRITEVDEPEMESARYLEDICMLRRVNKYTDLMRTRYTHELEEVFNIIMEKENKRKEKDLCEER